MLDLRESPTEERHVPVERAKLLPWVPALLWMGAIFGASTIPGSAIPGGYSTYGHLGEYAILGVLLFLAARRTPPWTRAALLSLVIASAYGVTDELHQFLTPGRTPDPADWAADTVGAAVGIALTVAVLLVLLARRRSDEAPPAA